MSFSLPSKTCQHEDAFNTSWKWASNFHICHHITKNNNDQTLSISLGGIGFISPSEVGFILLSEVQRIDHTTQPRINWKQNRKVMSKWGLYTQMYHLNKLIHTKISKDCLFSPLHSPNLSMQIESLSKLRREWKNPDGTPNLFAFSTHYVPDSNPLLENLRN